MSSGIGDSGRAGFPLTRTRRSGGQRQSRSSGAGHPNRDGGNWLRLVRTPGFGPRLKHGRRGQRRIAFCIQCGCEPGPAEALMFQAGYLTIQSARRIPGRMELARRYPNQEVRALIIAFFDSIPGAWSTNNPIADYEGYYASALCSYFPALGLDITIEDSSNKGRLGMAVYFENRIYLFEFKAVELTPQGQAMAQLKSKNYATKYLAQGRPIYLIGVEFSKEARTVAGFEVEALAVGFCDE